MLTDQASMAIYHAGPSTWPEGHIHHYFCPNCGVQVFSKGFLEMDDEIFNGWFYAVNLSTLHDNQLGPPAEIRHL